MAVEDVKNEMADWTKRMELARAGMELEKAEFAKRLELNEGELEVMLTDFGKASKVFFGNHDKQFGKIKDYGQKGYSVYNAGFSDVALFKNGLVWFGEKFNKYDTEDRLFGVPKDYLEIKDDFEKTKAFIAKTLDQGHVYHGTSYWNQDGEFESSLYISWMYHWCENKKFKKNAEKAIKELLTEAFNQEIKGPPYEKYLKEVTEELQKSEENRRFWWFGGDNLSSAIWRADLNKTETAEEIEMKKLFEKEVGKTEHPITLREFLSGFGGVDDLNKFVKDYYKIDDKVLKEKRVYELVPEISLTEFIKSLPDSEPLKKKYKKSGERYKRIHFNEISPGFRERYTQFYISQNARKRALKEYQPQFNRLVGLLETVKYVGKPTNGFADNYEMLLEKALNGKFSDEGKIKYDFNEVDMYRELMSALGNVQKGDSLKDFWLDKIETEKKTDRIVFYVVQFLNMYKNYSGKEGAVKHVPDIIDRLKRRKFDFRRDTRATDSRGSWHFIQNCLREITGYIDQFYTGRFLGEFNYLNMENATLDLLKNVGVKDGIYKFEFERFRTDGVETLVSEYDIRDNAITNPKLKETIDRYFKEDGYALNKINAFGKDRSTVHMFPGKARKIENKTRIVYKNKNLIGWYEGTFNIGSAKVPFLYNPKEGRLKLAGPIDKHKSKKVPVEKFFDAKLYGKEMQKIKDNAKWSWSSEFANVNEITPRMEPEIKNIIKYKMIPKEVKA